VDYEQRARWVQLLEGEMADIMRWVEMNISDHSAVVHLSSTARLLVLLSPEAKLASPKSIEFEAALHQVLVHSQSLVERYPSRENLWLYLRYAIQMAVGISSSPLTAADDTKLCNARTPSAKPDAVVDFSDGLQATIWKHIQSFLPTPPTSLNANEASRGYANGPPRLTVSGNSDSLDEKDLASCHALRLSAWLQVALKWNRP